jgi:hypothetical protein
LSLELINYARVARVRVVRVVNEEKGNIRSTLLFLSLELINYARVARVRVVRVVTEVFLALALSLGCSGSIKIRSVRSLKSTSNC